MEIDDRIDAVVFLLELDPVLERTEPVAYVEAAGRSHARKNPFLRALPGLRGGGHCPAGYPQALTRPARHLAVSPAMETPDAIRSRRTVKAFDSRSLDRATIDELLELARWAPNHHLTCPWRFRVLGPQALERLKRAAGELAAAQAPAGSDSDSIASGAAAKLDRAPTLIALTVERSDDPLTFEEDCAAAACAAYIVLLGAHDRGLAGYWRTPAVLRDPAGRAAAGIGPGEHFVGLIHLGHAAADAAAPERPPLELFVSYLD
jgi:nitroreductase